MIAFAVVVIVWARTATSEPESYLATGIGSAMFAALVIIARVYSQRKKQFKMTTPEIYAVDSFRIYDHLEKYLEKCLPSDKQQAQKYLSELVSKLSTRWALQEKANQKQLEDFDLVINTAARIAYSLAGVYRPIIDKGDKPEIENNLEYFVTLTKFFLGPTKERLTSVYDLSIVPPPEPEKPKRDYFKILKKRPLLTHAIILGAADVVSGGLTFYFTTPIGNNDQLGVLQTSLTVVAIITASYFGIVGLRRFMTKPQV